MTRRLTFKILGSGCSTGVPRIDGYWGACNPDNPKNRRSRCAAWCGVYDDASPEALTSVVIDTAPEFREQMVRSGVRTVDAVLWTHDHADQAHGIDDIRAFTFARGGPIDGYMDQATNDTLRNRFGYVFTGLMGYPPICIDHLIPPHGTAWGIDGPGGRLPITTFAQHHGPIQSVGYRIGDVAYSSDISDIPEESYPALHGLKLWVVDAMRRKPHPTHAHLSKTLEWVEQFRPEHTVLTNLHQEMDYESLRQDLPTHVEPAFDQMTFDLAL